MKFFKPQGESSSDFCRAAHTLSRQRSWGFQGRAILSHLMAISLTIMMISCEDSTVSQSGSGGKDSSPSLRVSTLDAEQDANIPTLDWEPPIPPEPELTREERCAQTSMVEVGAYCQCFPECCDSQRWYCPPNPQQTIDVMQVVVEICDENKVPCIFGVDPGCPPPEIISRSECITQWECPPGTSGEFIRWFECQLEDGTFGRQQIICDKGSLRHLPCRPCDPEACDGADNDCDNIVDEGRFNCMTECGEGWGFCVDGEVVDCNADSPGEERCNFLDDDCDGLIDEGQRNVCDDCGHLPADICNGQDDDCDGSTDEELARECETACERGVEICENGNWISCTAQQPVEEECDGEDNDCDGRVDEQLECLCTIQDVGNLMPCSEPPLLCGQGFKTCECVDPDCREMRVTDCAALCTYVDLPEPPPCNPRIGIALAQEECNNFDEDCDDLIDENLRQACYTGDPDTLLVGVCVPGEVYCDRGTWGNDRNNAFEPGYCAGEITPSQEICDGADNDCDGEVDYGEEIRDTDILFIVDWSGSMDQEIEAVKIALNRFAQHFEAEIPLQWGLIIGPKVFPNAIGHETLVLVSNISPFDQFLAAFAALGNDGMNTGEEMLLDAIYFAIRNISGNANIDIAAAQWRRNTGSIPLKENFNITWRPNADRIVIVFTDEAEQSYLDPQITKLHVEEALRAGINLKLYTFSSPFMGNWEDIAQAGNGFNFLLSSNAVSMYNDLMSIIDEACLPRPGQRGAGINMRRAPSQAYMENYYAKFYMEKYMRVADYYSEHSHHYDYILMECRQD